MPRVYPKLLFKLVQVKMTQRFHQDVGKVHCAWNVK